METFLGIVVGLFVLMFLVTAHEFGHFIMARRNGVKVLEFGICFPPRAIAWVKDKKTGKWAKINRKDWNKPQDGLVFSLNWLPIGGFCQMDGESAADDRKGTFGNASFKSKTKILFGGVAVNWLIAIIIFTILAWTGMPTFVDNQFTIDSDTTLVTKPISIVEVVEDSPAAKAGLIAGDQIISVDGQILVSTNDISDYNAAHAGEDVTYFIRHQDDTENNYNIRLNPADSEFLLGITMKSDQILSYSTWSAPIVGVGVTAQLTGETFRGVGIMLWNIVSGTFSQFSADTTVRENGQAALAAAGDSVSGPIGIIGIIFPSFTASGLTNLAFLTALISVSLACMNVLPIPALDGGRWLLIAIYKLRGKKLDKSIEEKIVARAFVILLALIAAVTILDITRFFR